MWNIHEEHAGFEVVKTFKCPHCNSVFTDEYGTEAEVTYVQDTVEKTTIRRYEYICPVCSVNVVREEKVQ